MKVRSGYRAAVLRGHPKSVLANTNMSQSQSPRGQLMAARDNPTTSTQQMVAGPPEQDRDIPTGGGSPISLGTSQPRGDKTRDELPLRHKNVRPHRGRI